MKIAFGYKMRTGKDSAVDYLISKYGGKKITFAKYLYEALFKTQEIFNFPTGKDRVFLQTVGDWARKKDKDVFVKLALNETEKDADSNFFCNDLRFVNEFNSLKKKGWTCVKIIRYNSYVNVHNSETELDDVNDWDYIIENNGTIEDFYEKIDFMISNMGLDA